jgi:hypothetical protein
LASEWQQALVLFTAPDVGDRNGIREDVHVLRFLFGGRGDGISIQRCPATISRSLFFRSSLWSRLEDPRISILYLNICYSKKTRKTKKWCVPWAIALDWGCWLLAEACSRLPRQLVPSQSVRCPRRPTLPSDRQKRKEKKFVVLGCSCWHRRRASRPLRQLTASVLPPPLLLPLLLLPLLLCLVRTAIPSFRLSGYFTKRLVVVVAVQSEVDGASRPRVALLLQSAVFDDGHRTRATATATRPPTP